MATYTLAPEASNFQVEPSWRFTVTACRAESEQLQARKTQSVHLDPGILKSGATVGCSW